MAAPLAARAFSYWWYRYRQMWHATVVTGIVTPVLFLAAMGLGLGQLVHRSSSALGGVSYLVFLAPGLLAANAMQIAGGESSWPVLSAIKWQRTYYAMLATPIGVTDVLYGHLAWIAARVTMVSAFFLGAMAVFGAVHSWLAVAALPAAVLTGMAFATPIAAYSATRQGTAGLTAIYRFGIIPLFLFAGTFFPVSQLPAALRWIAYVTPLWHGVTLCRELTLGRAGVGVVGHVAVLLAVMAVGVAAARRTYTRRLSV